MTLFGLVYRVLPHWGSGKPPALGVARAHFYFSVVGVIGDWANGMGEASIKHRLGKLPLPQSPAS